jgi:hypothetical protein
VLGRAGQLAHRLDGGARGEPRQHQRRDHAEQRHGRKPGAQRAERAVDLPERARDLQRAPVRRSRREHAQAPALALDVGEERRAPPGRDRFEHLLVEQPDRLLARRRLEAPARRQQLDE